MANWQDPQTTGAGAATVSVPRAARDVGLRSYMLSVYNYMASGVLLTGIVALLLVNSQNTINAALFPNLPFDFVRDIAPIAGVFRVEATDPDLSFAVQVGQSVAVRDGSAPGDAPCLRGGAVELVEALSIRAPLPDSTPPEWRRLLAGLATAFDSESAFR